MNRIASAVLAAAAALAAALLTVACGKSSPGDSGTGPIPEPHDTSAAPTPLVIEEIAPGNVDFQDERGEDPGWVEISNVSDSAIDLGAWRLRGEDDDGPAWRLPDTSLGPGGRMLIFCSGLDRRRATPAGDTLKGFSGQAYAWSDSLNNPPGRSSFGPWEIPGGMRGILMPDSVPALSATLNLRDPAGALEWSAVEFSTPLPAGAGNLADRNRMLLRATLPEGQPLLLRFCESGQECWKGATLRVIGTGRRLDTYDLSLLGVPTDFGRLAQIAFVPPTGRFGTYRFTVVDIRFYRAALHPHASLELHRKGGTLHLEDTAGARRQTVAYPEMPATASWARLPPGRTYVRRDAPSPAAANPSDTPAVIPAAPPRFLTPAGYHAEPLVVRLEPASGGTVRCATGGAPPDSGSLDATRGFAVDSTQALTCAVFDSAGRPGPTASALFIIGIIGERPALPVVSIIVDSAAMFDSVRGLYMEGPDASPAEPHYGANYWEDTELPAEVAFFERDGRQAFSERAGVGIFGNWSRAKPKRPLSVQFRERYGARRIQYPLFPQQPRLTRFKGFALRNMGGDYAAGFSRDALGTALTEGRGLEYQLSRHVAAYINGRYWGIYDMRERLDADYLDTRYGLPADAVELIKNGGEVQAGTAAFWNATVDWFLRADLADSAALAEAATKIDLDNMAAYLAAEIWSSNADWPANNTRAWRRTSPATPWRMMLFDLDGGLGGFSGERDMFAFLGDSTVTADYPNGPRSTVFFRRLSANAAWRARFANRLCAMLATDFAPARALAALDSMEADVAGEIERDRARWNLSRDYRITADTRIRAFLGRRPAAVLAHMRAWYKLGDSVTVALRSEGGTVSIEGFDVGSEYRGTHFAGLPVRVSARSAGGAFAGWSDGVTAAERVVVPEAGGVELTATFR